MYHGRFKKSHYEAGLNFGRLLYNNGKLISNNHTFKITEERKKLLKIVYLYTRNITQRF